MGKFIDWLFGRTDDAIKEAKKVLELVEEAPVEQFVDEETGKEYKSARSLKAAQTRRKNAAKKGGKKTSKKKTRKTKK